MKTKEKIVRSFCFLSWILQTFLVSLICANLTGMPLVILPGLMLGTILSWKIGYKEASPFLHCYFSFAMDPALEGSGKRWRNWFS